jgi:hypothetical protein
VMTLVYEPAGDSGMNGRITRQRMLKNPCFAEGSLQAQVLAILAVPNVIPADSKPLVDVSAVKFMHRKRGLIPT